MSNDGYRAKYLATRLTRPEERTESDIMEASRLLLTLAEELERVERKYKRIKREQG